MQIIQKNIAKNFTVFVLFILAGIKLDVHSFDCTIMHNASFAQTQQKKSMQLSSKSKQNQIVKRRQNFINTAKKYLGAPYKYGGLSKKGMDCSGFVYQSARLGVGVQLPRSSSAMAKVSQRIAKKDRRAGDLIFFVNKNKRVFHVGIYLGKNKFIHSSKSSGVIISSLSNLYWKGLPAFYGRIIN